jgi:hypothetical protein
VGARVLGELTEEDAGEEVEEVSSESEAVDMLLVDRRLDDLGVWS